MLESKFQRELKKELSERFDGCIVLNNDANFLQGFPDLTILYHNKWAVLECKQSPDSPYRPNQKFYLKLLDAMSFARSINPDNKEEVLNELQRAFSS